MQSCLALARRKLIGCNVGERKSERERLEALKCDALYPWPLQRRVCLPLCPLLGVLVQMLLVLWTLGRRRAHSLLALANRTLTLWMCLRVCCFPAVEFDFAFQVRGEGH